MKCIMLATKCPSTNILYNSLSKKMKIDALIIENKEKMCYKLIKRRIKRLGLFTVLGQILFRAMVVPVLTKKALNRINEIYKENDLNAELDYENIKNYFAVENASSKECEKIIKSLNPDLIILNGTSIIKENILNCTSAKIINIHAGITPKYRGVHGAYWALYNSDNEHCGVTVHFVDKGIDTGNIIYQNKIHPTSKDNFVTYPALQIAAAIDIHYQAILDIEQGNVKTITNNLPSKLYYHPTIWQYLYARIFKKVK